MVDKRDNVYKARLLADFVRNQHAKTASQRNGRPLLVSMQGPQGAGKSTVSVELVRELGEGYEPLVCAVASLDDFYLDHQGLVDLAALYPDNKMLGGRGPPGTHDLSLLERTLTRIRNGDPPSPSQPIHLPIFDKSKFSGQGDRSPHTIDIISPISIFLLEGWSLGYTSLPQTSLPDLHQTSRTASTHPLSSLQQINTNLSAFDSAISPYFDCHIAIKPQTYDYVYSWRLQQEHMMKAANGGVGMTDQEVETFVDRYMPVYEVFGETGPERDTLRLIFGSEREVIETVKLDSRG